MQRTDFDTMPCPIAHSLARVGERWSMLILRDAYYGMSRFDEFRKSLNIAPNILARRLSDLVEAGLLEKRQYSDKPARYEYALTDLGRDFRPVMLALIAWGNRNFASEGDVLQLVERDTGAPVEQRLIETRSGRTVAPEDCRVIAGPAATPIMRYRLDFAQLKRNGESPDVRFDPESLADLPSHF
jgi:DNA-binding HxlR family transcriptional regulator